MGVKAPAAEMAEMLELRKQGLTYRQIAARYGMSDTAVRYRLGLTPAWSPYRRSGDRQLTRFPKH